LEQVYTPKIMYDMIAQLLNY